MFRFNNHTYKVVARTTDDFGVTTETGINLVMLPYINMSMINWEIQLMTYIVFKTWMQITSQLVY